MKKFLACLVIAAFAGSGAFAGGEPLEDEVIIEETVAEAPASSAESTIPAETTTEEEVVAAPGPNRIGEALMFYIPNRILDALDCFSVGVGLGPTIRIELMATRAIDVGFGLGYQYKLFKDYNRQYGLGTQESYYYSFIFIADEDTEREHIWGWVKDYHESFLGIPTIDQPIYDFYQGKRDYWQIGGALGLLLEGEVYIHPVELVDFVAGIFFIDLRQDDLRASDF